MIRHHRSPPAPPRERGREFGAAHGAQVRETARRYAELFTAVAGRPVDVPALGAEALAAIGQYSADCASEIEGIADGAGLPAEVVAALNARTEILARLGAPQRGECSTVVLLDGATPTAVQTWDWHEELQGSWLVWTIEHPDGHVVHTLTEYGIVGKIGVTSAGLGLHLNILHHRDDGGPARVPVHVLARTVLDRASDIGQALSVIAGAPVSASSAMTLVAVDAGEPVAMTAEVFPGGPRYVGAGPAGLILHTNHFLAPEAAAGDREITIGPDSFLRHDVLQRRLAARAGNDTAAVLAAMHSHAGGGGAVCCHPDPAAGLGARYATLATVSLDVRRGSMAVRAGGPCAGDSDWWTTDDSADMRQAAR